MQWVSAYSKADGLIMSALGRRLRLLITGIIAIYDDDDYDDDDDEPTKLVCSPSLTVINCHN